MSRHFVANPPPQFVTRVRQAVDKYQGADDTEVHNYDLSAVAKQVLNADKKQHNSKLVAFKAHNETAVTTNQATKKEALDEWMNALTIRLEQACHNPVEPYQPVSPGGSGLPPLGSTSSPAPEARRRKNTPVTPEGAALPDEGKNVEPVRSTAKPSKSTGKGRWKTSVQSTTNLSENTIGHLSDSNYLEKIQSQKQSKETLFTLQERLVQKKTTLDPEEKATVRPKESKKKSKKKKEKEASGEKAAEKSSIVDDPDGISSYWSWAN